MTRVPIFVSVEGAEKLKKLSRELKDAGRGDLRKQLRAAVKDAGRPVVDDLRLAVMGVDVSSSRGGKARPSRSTGLRRDVAKATGLSVTQTGIRIRASARRQPFPTAAKYLDASVGKFARWRHPVFGKDVWVEQKGEPWFFTTIAKHRTAFRRAVFGVMEDMSRKITD